MEGRVVGIGEILWDMLPEGKQLGGAPANFAYHVSQFGLPGCVASAVGDDALGREILAEFTDRGVDREIAVVPYPTGTVQVELDSHGVPQYDIREGVAWDNIPYTDALDSLARSTVAVCFGSLAQRGEVSRATINRFLDAMPAGDARLVVFDVNLRQKYYSMEILHDSMTRCNILKINDEELAMLSEMLGHPGADAGDMCSRLLADYGLKILILTCGTRGSYVYTPGKVSYMPTPEVEVADTVGAGDSFTAAFVAAILKGKPVEEAHRMAVATSAYVCTMKGATPELPCTLKST